MDFDSGELKPAFIQDNFKLVEQTPTTVNRTNNGYVVKNNTVMLQYEELPYIENDFSDSVESINPYDNYTFTGSMTLSPPGDTWFSTSDKPLIYRDDTGAYDTFIPDSVGEATYGSVWGSWKQFWYTPSNKDAAKAVQGGVVITDASTTGSSTNAVFPFLRSASIRFTAKKLKPNTKMFAFFNEYNVTDFCKSANTTSNVTFTGDFLTANADIITDDKGTVTGTFNYNLDINSLRIPAGSVKFRLTDSPTDSSDKESFADAIYTSSGTISYTEPPRVVYSPPVVFVDTPSPPPANTVSPVYDPPDYPGSAGPLPPAPPAPPPKAPVIGLDYIVVGALYNEGAGANYNWASDPAVAQAYRDAVATYAAERGSSLTIIQQAAVNTPAGYDFNRELAANDGGTQYTFQSGPAIATINPTSALADPGYVLPNGITVDKYLTATNILSATDSSGRGFTERVASITGADFNTTIVPIFEATKETIATIVDAGTPTADMLSFWEVGLANGSFPNTEAGIQTAISNYSAAITLSIIEDGASGNSAWDTLRTNGVASQYA
jgi:hypothetical protein